MEWLRKQLLTENPCYKAGRKITPTGIMLHSTGANNPNLRRYLAPDDGIIGRNTHNNHWNQAGYNTATGYKALRACYHAFMGLGTDGNLYVYQVLPWNHRGWHAGGTANDTHISLGICEGVLTDKNYFGRVYDLTVKWSAYICQLMNITPLQIIDHAEGRRQGIASNHADVGHWFPLHGKSFKTVRSDVLTLLTTPKEEEKAYTVQVGYFHNKANAERLLKNIRTDYPDAFIREVPRRV